MTVYKNMGFGLKLRKVPASEIDRRVKKAAEILGISDLLERKPKALSGGQRQRVALGRAIVREPNVFLLDEPLSNLDAKLRVQMRSEIIKLHKKLATTFIYVTHDQTEAMTMGDRIVVMKDGFIQQIDSPATLYEQPINVFVATFLGSPQMNVFPADLIKDGDTLKVAFGDGNAVKFGEYKAKQLADTAKIGQKVLFGIRPENVCLSDSGVAATVDVVEHLGSETIVYASVKGLDNNVIVKIPTDHSITAGKQVYLEFDMDKSHLFDEETKQSIMGVPAVNKFDCTLKGGVVKFADTEWELPESISERLFDFAESTCVSLNIATGRVSLDQTPDSIKIDGVVDFTFAGSDSLSIFAKVAGKNDYFVMRSKNFDVKAGDKLSFYVPYSAVSLCDKDGVRLNSREIVSDNVAVCDVKTANGKTTVNVGGSTLNYDDLGVADGKYRIKLLSDKLDFVYDKKYAKKNKTEIKDLPNVLTAKAYDEDKLGGKNAVFVSVKGWDTYVTAVLSDDFSVYKMPVFGLSIPKEAVVLLPLD